MVQVRLVGRLVAGAGGYAGGAFELTVVAGGERHRVQLAGAAAERVRRVRAGTGLVVDGRWTSRGHVLVASSVRTVDQTD